MIIKLREGGGGLFSLFTVCTFNYTLLFFHVEKGWVFISHNGFRIGAKKCLILVFHGTSGVTAITGWYHYLIELGDRALSVPSLDRGGITIGSINCQWYTAQSGWF